MLTLLKELEPEFHDKVTQYIGNLNHKMAFEIPIWQYENLSF